MVDETWASIKMARTHGRCPRGERPRVALPHGHRKMTTLVAGLSLKGIVAPMVLDRAINGRSFQAYVQTFLALILTEGDVVITDLAATRAARSVSSLRRGVPGSSTFRPTAPT